MTFNANRNQQTSGIFISYRHGVTTGHARALYQSINSHFENNRIFIDVDSLIPGTDFVEKIEKAIASSAVLLALIGDDWTGDSESQRSLNNPDDFIRLELKTALQHNVPIIPVLCERTSMPTPQRLPEELRPLARYEALDLENARWQPDIDRLIHILKPLASPVAEKAIQRSRWPHTSSLSRKAISLTAFGCVLLGALVTIAALLSRHNAETNIGSRVSAATEVASVTSADRLADSLLTKDLKIYGLPGATSHASAQISDSETSIEQPGLVIDISFSLPGNSASSYVNYSIFRDRANAKASFGNANAVSQGFNAKGAGFAAVGVADPTMCQESRSTTVLTSNCVILSDKVIIFTQLQTKINSDQVNKYMTSKLARQAISYLAKVAASTPRFPLSPPPGPISPSSLFASLSRPSNSSLRSIGRSLSLLDNLASVVVQSSAVPSEVAPRGLLKQEAINVIFADHPGLYGNPGVRYYVFRTAQQAQAWFTPPLAPSNTERLPGGQFDTSGFAQSARCDTYSSVATSESPTFGIAACFIRWGNVVLFAAVDRRPNLVSGDTDLAWVLARWGISYLDIITGS